MPAKDLGSKYVCFKCSTKFYDLKRPDPLCPKCGADQREGVGIRAAERKSRLSAVPKVVEPAEAPAAEEPELDAFEDAEEEAEEEEEA